MTVFTQIESDKKAYDAVMKEQLDLGVIETVTQLSDRVHYIPHLAVVSREASTTKVCVVYNASVKLGNEGTSLNDCLHVGPSLNPLLFNILLGTDPLKSGTKSGSTMVKTTTRIAIKKVVSY